MFLLEEGTPFSKLHSDAVWTSMAPPTLLWDPPTSVQCGEDAAPEQYGPAGCRDPKTLVDPLGPLALLSGHPRAIKLIPFSLLFLSLSPWQTGRIEPNYPKVCGHQGNVLDIKWNPFIDNIIASCSEDTSVSRRGAARGGWAHGDSSCFLLEAFLPKFPPSPFFAPLLSSWSSLQLAPGQGVRKGTGSKSMNCMAGLVPLP